MIMLSDFLRSHNCVITINEQLSTIPLENHSNSSQHSFMTICAMTFIHAMHVATLYKLFCSDFAVGYS